MTEDEKEALKEEMVYYEHLLCPDANSLVVEGQSFGVSHFELYGKAKPAFFEGDVPRIAVY